MGKVKAILQNKIIKFFPKADGLDKPIPARGLVPDWYKNQNSYDSYNHPTVKRCIPIFDAMTSGYYLVAQSDITVDSSNPGGLITTSSNTFNGQLFSQHDLSQYDSYPIPDGYHKHLLRIHPMWAVRTPEEYSSLFINPIHGGSKNILAVSGLIDTDSFIADGHLSFFVKENTTFKIKKGTPIIQVIPVKRDEWEAEEATLADSIEAIKKQDNSGILVDGVHQTGSYKKLFHSTKSFK